MEPYAAPITTNAISQPIITPLLILKNKPGTESSDFFAVARPSRSGR